MWIRCAYESDCVVPLEREVKESNESYEVAGVE